MNETTLEFQISDNQEIYNGDELTIKLTLTATNEGTATAYNAKFNLKIDKNAEYIETKQTTKALSVIDKGIKGDEKLINVIYQGQIVSKSYLKCDLYFKVKFGEKENLNRQESDVKHSISYKINTVRKVGDISLTAENLGDETNPKYKLTAKVSDLDSSYDINNAEYIFYRKIEGVDKDYKVINRTKETIYIDEPFSDITEAKSYKISYKVVGKFPNGRTLDSTNKQNYYEDSYEVIENKEEKNGFPFYAIIIIIVLGIALIVGSGFLIYKLMAKKGIETIAISSAENADVVKTYAGEKAETSEVRLKNRRSLKNKSVVSVSNNNANNN